MIEDYGRFSGELQKADELIKQKKFEEALPGLLTAYREFTAPIDYYSWLDEMGEEGYIGVHDWLCYRIAFCYNDRKEYDRAYYYINQVSDRDNFDYMAEWINTMVNSNFPGIIELIEAYLEKPEEFVNTLSGEDDRKRMKDFLERRLGYLMIEYGRIEEARQLFTRMLDNPNSCRFAREELDYIADLMEDGEE